jgi:hypothetical protein
MPLDYLRETMQIVVDLRGERLEKLSAATRVAHDLHIEGNDAEEFLLEYSRRLGVDLTAFEFARHFSGEGVFPELVWRIRRGFPIRMVPLTLGRLAEAAAQGRWCYDRGVHE